MAYLDDLKRLSIDGIVLPYKEIEIRGGIRHHEHEYPHVAGGLAEKLGRKLYEVRIELAIDEGIAKTGYYQGRNLITNLNELMSEVFEAEKSVPVYLPNIGEIPLMFATDWTRNLNVLLRSGEKASIAMKEDNDAASLIAKTLKIAPPAALATMLGDLEAVSPTPMPGLLEQLRDAVNQILAFRDTTQMWAGFVAAKIEGLQNLFEEIDSGLEDLKDPESWGLLEALRNLWGAVKDLGEEVGIAQTLGKYITPRDMSVQDISIAIYGDGTYGIDILNLNALEDPYNVQAATTIKYFKDAA